MDWDRGGQGQPFLQVEDEITQLNERERRTERYNKLHANYDDPPRRRPWWQFWRRDEESSE